ncbi:uncharacterized protein IUM83_05272 [Phytophthora cinnamomi]|uniref:uncharacterized protein n=1 Tax=Phytophthora cinnamomi TaxID=4785 RepID=UPI00355A3B46|nr:hypothetical protein IUM83_05272 [Phytophthora cinnamomi]
MQRGPPAPDGGAKASSLRPASTVGPAPGVLPAINAGAPPSPAIAPRGVSPNVAKRAAWSTPRDRLGTPESRPEQQQTRSVDADGAPPAPRHEQGQTPTSTMSPSSSVAPLEDALEMLHAVLVETDDRSDRARRRQAALEETKRLHAAEEVELERTRFAADEQLQMTLELLQAELARERRLRTSGDGSKPATAVIAPPVDRKSPSKRQAARLATRLRNSPLKPRVRETVPTQLEERETAEEGIRGAVFDRDMTADSLHASVREVKLHELREERARWQRDYEVMREQVIEEKARQTWSDSKLVWLKPE